MLDRLLFLVLLAFQAEAQRFYAVKDLPVSVVDRVREEGRFYGTYGHDLSVVTGRPSSVVESLIWEPVKVTGAAPYALHVFEVRSSAGLEQVEKLIQQYPASSPSLVYASKTEVIVQTQDFFFQFDLTSEIRQLYSEIENIITIPTHPYAPTVTADSTPSTRAKDTADARIQAAVRQVSIQNLQWVIGNLSAINTRQSASPGAKEAEAYLAAQFTLYGANVSYFSYNSSQSRNVIAKWNGQGVTSPQVIVGAHYDSRSTTLNSTTQRAPGAVDNGSGTAALVEMARLINLTRINTSFYYPIQLIAFSGEEQGLQGSRAQAQEYKKQNPNYVQVMLNADMLAWPLPNTTTYTLGFKDRYVSATVTARCKALAVEYVPSLRTANSSSCCSDYQAFNEQGWAVAGFFQNSGAASDYPYYHTSNDLPNQVDWTQQSLETQAVIASALTYTMNL